MRYLATSINDQIKGSIAAYVPHPGPDFISIYRRFIANIGYDRMRFLARGAEEHKLKRNIIYHDFVTALVSLNDSNKTLEAWRWLTANRLTLEERRMLGVASSIEHSEDALSAFSALIKFLRSVGFRLICMLIDEFEEINSLMQLQKRKLFNDLRHLIDLNVANFSLIIACTPHGWETIYEENAALVRRFSSNVIFLEPLRKNSAIDLISKYLDAYRCQKEEFELFARKNGYNEVERRIYPFTEDAIQEICSISKGNTGEILKYSGIALELGALEGCPRIDLENLRHFIAKYYGRT